MRTRVLTVAFLLVCATTARAQSGRAVLESSPRTAPSSPGSQGTSTSGVGQAQSNPILGSVPDGQAIAVTLPLALSDAIARALRNNLGLLAGEHRVDEALAGRERATSRLLPTVASRVAISEQQINLAAFGFAGLGDAPSVVGPFPLFDARLFLSQSLFDFDALRQQRAEARKVDVARFEAAEVRRLVVEATTVLYLQGVSAGARIEAARAQLETAGVLHALAVDLKEGGLVAGIDVLRAELQRDAARQRVIVAEHDLEKQKLLIARVIGLPIGQAFDLVDAAPYAPLVEVPLDEALRDAYATRPDYRAAQARVEAAEEERRAAGAQRLPAADLTADIGSVGQTVTRNAHGTFSVVGSVRIPIFAGGEMSARVVEADARLRQRREELASFRARVEYEIRVALLDVKAASEQVQLAERSVRLANEELVQARNRFAAGIASNIEVVEAQGAVATATENHLASLYAHTVARLAVAHAMGTTEDAMTRALGEGQQ